MARLSSRSKSRMLELLDRSRRWRAHRIAHDQALGDGLLGNLLVFQNLHQSWWVNGLPGLGTTTAQALAQALVGVGHDGGHGVGRVAAEQRFDLDHRNVVAAADDHVLAVADGAQMTTKPVPGLGHHRSFSPGRR